MSGPCAAACAAPPVHELGQSLRPRKLCAHAAHGNFVRTRQAATLASLAEARTDGTGPAHALPPALHSLCVSGVDSKHSVPPASGMRDAVRPQAKEFGSLWRVAAPTATCNYWSCFHWSHLLFWCTLIAGSRN